MTHSDFKIFYNKYFDETRRFIYYKCGDTELATDIAQETFLKIWEKKVEPQQGKEISLVFKISSNIFISKIRRIKTEMNYCKSMQINTLQVNNSNELERKELEKQYEKALSNLSEKQRTVFLMSRIDELSYKDMSEQLGISVKAVEKRMSQALASLRKALL